MDDRCYGCDVDPTALGWGDPCPCTPPPYVLDVVYWRPGGNCVMCGAVIVRRRTMGRPPTRCVSCSPSRRAYRRRLERAVRG